jgi:hypothetical protein
MITPMFGTVSKIYCHFQNRRVDRFDSHNGLLPGFTAELMP